MQIILGLIISSTSYGSVALPQDNAIEQVRRFCVTAGLDWPESAELISVYPPKKAVDRWQVGLKGIGSFRLNIEQGPVTSFSTSDPIRRGRDHPSKSERGETPAFSSESAARRHMTDLAHRLGMPRGWHIETFEVKPDTYDEFERLDEPGLYILRFTKPTRHVVFEGWHGGAILVDYVTGKLVSFAYNKRGAIVEAQPRITRSQAISTATDAFELPDKRGQSVIQSVDLGYYVSTNERKTRARSQPMISTLVWRIGFDHPKHVEPEYTYISALTGEVIDVLRFR